MRHYPEIVKVLDHSRLIDSESYEHSYWALKPRALSTGYYVVTWPEHVLRPRFDESARFAGPFSTYAHARNDLDRQLQLDHRKSA